MKYLKKFDTQQEKQTLLGEGIYIEPHVNWIAENDEVNYNNLDKTLVAPYGMHLTGDSHQYTIGSDGTITGVTGLTIPILLDGELNLIRAGSSSGQSKLDNYKKYAGKTVTVYDLDLNEGWKYSNDGYIISKYWTYSKTLYFGQHFSQQWKRVLLGNDGKWYDLKYYTYNDGTHSYQGYVLEGDGIFDGYCFEYGSDPVRHQVYAEFRKTPKTWNASYYNNPIWCYIEEV